MQKQIQKCKYTDTNKNIEIHKHNAQMYTYTPFISSDTPNQLLLLFDVTEHYLANIEQKHKSVGGKGL